MERLIQNLQKLTLQPGISGNEKTLGISGLVLQLLSEVNPDNSYVDKVGNVVSIVGTGPRKIIIDAHIDEVGFIVTKSTGEDVFLTPIGVIPHTKSVDSKVEVLGSKISGVVTGDERCVQFKCDSATDYAQIKAGDLVSYARSCNVENDIVSATALDNRIGCTCLIEVLNNFMKAPVEGLQVIFVFSVGEELRQLSMYHYCEMYKPDFGIIVDSAYAKPISFSDILSIPELGEGCAIQHCGEGFVINSKNINLVKEIAKQSGISTQDEIPNLHSGNTNYPNLVLASVPGCIVNIPVRNQHSQQSEANINDLKSAVSLIQQVLQNYQQFID